LDELGYDVEWQLFKSKEFVAQNRERLFIIGHLRGAGTKKIFLSQEKKDQLIKNQEGSI
jgi:DNA (cytosine-5)-methyltransferase 1